MTNMQEERQNTLLLHGGAFSFVFIHVITEMTKLASLDLYFDLSLIIP